MKQLVYLILLIGIASTNILFSQGQNSLWKPLEETYLHADTEANIIKEEIKDGVLLQSLYFYSHHINDTALNVYAIYARPLKYDGEKLPGLVHIHGGGGTAKEEVVLFHAKRGYATITYDWTGPEPFRDSLRVTHFPKGLLKNRDLSNDITENKFYHTLFVARRAISFLAEQKEIDAKRIGVTGESWGGAHTFRLNALDARIAVVAPIYGVYSDFLSRGNEAWEEIYGTLNYLQEQKAPLFFLTPTNDFSHVKHFEAAQEYMEKLRVDKRQVWIANEDHGVRPKPLEAMYRFLDHYLQGAPALPPSPTLSYEKNKNTLTVSVAAQGATSVNLFYSYGDAIRPSGGIWLPMPCKALGYNEFSAELPIPNGVKEVRFYAQAFYSDAFEMSSLAKKHTVNSKSASQKITPLTVLYDPATMGIAPWYFQWTSNGHGNFAQRTIVELRPSLKDHRLCLVEESLPPFDFNMLDSKPGFHVGKLRTLADPLRAASKNAQLHIEFYCPLNAEVNIELRMIDLEKPKKWVLSSEPNSPVFTYEGVQKGKNTWRKFILNSTDFTDKNGDTLNSFEMVRQLQLSIYPEGKFHPEIGRIYWDEIN